MGSTFGGVRTDSPVMSDWPNLREPSVYAVSRREIFIILMSYFK